MMTSGNPISRRSALIGGGGLCAGALTGCGSGGSGGGGQQQVEDFSAAGALAPLADLEIGVSRIVEVNGADIALLRTGETEVVAYSAVCTHTGCTVNGGGMDLNCPCHGSRFDASTGEVLDGPASRPLASIPVKVEGDQVIGAAPA